jgi:hypothetical protein
LSAGHQKLTVVRPSDRECTPKPASFEYFELAMYEERIPQPGWTAIVYLCPHHNGAITLAQHFAEWIPHLLGQQRPIRLDESQISDVVHKAARVGVEEHDANFRV